MEMLTIIKMILYVKFFDPTLRSKYTFGKNVCSTEYDGFFYTDFENINAFNGPLIGFLTIPEGILIEKGYNNTAGSVIL